MIARLKTFFEANLASKEIAVEKILDYSGGGTTVVVLKVTNGAKTSYRLVVNEAVQNDYETFEAALSKIQKGLLQYGIKSFLHKDFETIVDDYLQ